MAGGGDTGRAAQCQRGPSEAACAKHWHDTEAAFTKDKQHGWTDKKLKVAKKKRTAKAGTTSTAVSGLRTAELQVEFIRLCPSETWAENNERVNPYLQPLASMVS